MNNTKRLVLMAALTAAALTIFVAEAQIPIPLPIPGLKLGLANIITLTAMYMLGRREAGLILLVRILLGSFFAGSVSALIFSISGGALSFAVMCIAYKFFDKNSVWIVSVLSAIAHNAGQLAAAVIVSGTVSILYYTPVLLAAAIATGVFTGLASKYLILASDKIR